MERKALINFFYEKEKATPDNPFLNQPFGDDWEMYTWGQVGQMARKIANYILQQDLPKGSKIGLVSKNCREWVIADLAIMMAEMVSVPFFPTLTGDQLAEVLDIGDVAFLFVGKTEVWDNMKTGVPSNMPVVRFPHYEGCDKIDIGEDWNAVLENTSPLEGTPSAGMDDLWTIVFTSGTTGTPKGVMHDYNNVFEIIDYNKKENPLRIVLDGSMRQFSYLPLNHIAERTLLVFCIAYGGQIFYTENMANFTKNLNAAKPTIFFAVPRIWTKFMQGVLAKMPQPALDAVLSDPVKAPMVQKQIATQFGLQNSISNITGAAPIAQATKDWWAKLGLPIGEVFGMTENSAFCTFLPDDVERPGSVGQTHPCAEIKIDEATGEILTRAPWTMKGYYKSPEKTAETLEADGWLHTGDKGRLDEDGYLYIIGRVKDTFKTAKGKFIVPTKVEDHFSNNNDIEVMCLLGLGMPQPVLMVALSEIGLSKSKEEVEASLNATLNAANEQLPNYSKVTSIVIANSGFQVESGTLTPTLKVKRSKVHELFKDDLHNYCTSPDSIIWT